MRRRNIFPLLAAVALPVIYALSMGQPLRPSDQPAADGDYVGSDTCITCHEDQGKRFKGTVMGKAFAEPRTANEKHGCEACHGPGKAHVEAGGGKETIPLRF